MSFTQEGRYRGEIIAHDLVESPSAGSQAIGFAMLVRWNALYDRATAEWYAIVDAAGNVTTLDENVTVWIVGQRGNLNEYGVRQLAESIGWNGDMNQLVNHSFAGITIQADVREETYEGKTALRASWVYHAEASVGMSGKPVPSQRLQELSQRLGGALRVVCGAGTPVPAGKPLSPPPASAPVPVPAHTPAPAATSQNPNENPPF